MLGLDGDRLIELGETSQGVVESDQGWRGQREGERGHCFLREFQHWRTFQLLVVVLRKLTRRVVDLDARDDKRLYREVYNFTSNQKFTTRI